MQIAYIHGLNSSSCSFNYLCTMLPNHSITAITYNSHQPLLDSIAQVKKQLPKGEVSLVGHSLGGLIAVLLAAECADRVNKLVTISTPFAGSKIAHFFRWLPGHPAVLKDIVPHAEKIIMISQLKLQIPTLSIISVSGGLATASEPNDSVVSVSSQKALKFGKKVEVKANHFEILLNDKTIKLVKDFLFDEPVVEKI